MFENVINKTVNKAYYNKTYKNFESTHINILRLICNEKFFHCKFLLINRTNPKIVIQYIKRYKIEFFNKKKRELYNLFKFLFYLITFSF